MMSDAVQTPGRGRSLEASLRAAATALRAGTSAELPLGDAGRIGIEQPLPYVCSYQKLQALEPRCGERLVTPQASYVVAPPDTPLDPLIDMLAQPLLQRFGQFADVRVSVRPADAQAPAFWVRACEDPTPWTGPLTRVRVEGRKSRVEASSGLTAPTQPGVSRVEIEVAAIYRDDEQLFPLTLMALEREFALALRHALQDFVRARTTRACPTLASLGRRRPDPAAREVDRHLDETARQFDFLLLSTPTNTREVWEKFAASGFQRAPHFRYRRLPIDPEVCKRGLFASPIEDVEDPALAGLFREKQQELDRKINMLMRRGSDAYRHGSALVYGEVEDSLIRSARRLLFRLPAHDVLQHRSVPSASDQPEQVEAGELAERAREQIERYRQRCEDFEAQVVLEDDLAAGLLVSGDTLRIASELQVTPRRAEALLGHEVGTHLLTFVNGRRQPLRLFRSGFAGYEELQEGLAVLAEYLVGGLCDARLRVLAGRVVACAALLDGASFVDTFRLLREELGFAAKSAYYMALRVFRGGGLTKDAMYLRGLTAALELLSQGEPLADLYVGKVSLDHLDVLRDLRERGLAREAAVLPFFLEDPAAHRVLERLRKGASILHLVNDPWETA